CLAEITSDGKTGWFGPHLPADLVLGDPGARDAAIHAIQACIPHVTLLPVGIDRLVLRETQATDRCLVRAWERSREGNTFIYDLEVAGADGCIRESVEGLRLQMVGEALPREAWAAPLLGPYVERCLWDLVPGSTVTVA